MSPKRRVPALEKRFAERAAIVHLKRMQKAGEMFRENRDAVTLDRNLLDNLPLFDQDYVAPCRNFSIRDR
jgi:hypothetical protein